jgi:hypothetical protein
MHLVRCDACGAKAMLAASQCPKCAEPLYVRNERGDEVRLVRCRSCETYYPASRDGCRWCPAVPRTAIPRGIGKAVVGVLSIAASLGGWQFFRASNPPSPTPNVMTLQSAAAVPRLASVAVIPSPEKPSTPRATVLSGIANNAPVARMANPTPSVAATSAPTREPSSAVAKEPRPSRTAGATELVSAKATTWVNVRADANSKSAIVGMIFPDSVVELGEARGGWRRVDTRWFSGWAVAKLFTVDSVPR